MITKKMVILQKDKEKGNLLYESLKKNHLL